MKRNLLFLFLFFSVGVRAQWVSIPDTNFGTWLNTNGYSACLQGNNSVGWQMDTSCPAVVNVVSINCSLRAIRNMSGIQYFDSLKVLNCNFNQISSIPALPKTLTYLSSRNNSISSLPVLPNSLTHLECDGNQIAVLPALPNTMSYLQCHGNLLTALPSHLPDSLKFFGCGGNNLTYMPPLPAVLTQYGCDDNQLSYLPPLPPNLVSLYCGRNQLTSLPQLPQTLWMLSCDHNLLTTLPPLPDTLNYIWAYDNLFTSLPELPDTLSDCSLDNNPLLTCLPKLKRIFTLSFTNTAVQCIPNFGSVYRSYPPLDSLFLCDVYNPNDCDFYLNIRGKAYFDSNTNCLIDGSDSLLTGIKMELRSAGSLLNQTQTLASGVYWFDTDSFATYTIATDTSNLPFYVSCPASGFQTSVISAFDSSDYDMDFGFECKSGFDLAAWSIQSRLFRPGNFTTVNIHAGDIANFYGVRCAAGVSGVVSVTINGPVTYSSPAPGALTPNVTGNVLTYNIADFGTVNFKSDFNIIVHTDTNATLGSQVCFTVSVTPIAGDNSPSNNTLSNCFTIGTSYDPNNKEVYPEGNTDTSQHWFTYTINFQNTGTVEAQHIYLTDTIDSDLDVSSFQLLAYSDQPVVQIKENAVRFNFPNINLPDSNTNEPLSHGYVQYKIKLKDNLPIGTQINNTAFIYFDFNAPVVTNTTVNTIAVISGISETRNQKPEIRIYPNPANESVTISVDESMIRGNVTVSDITGRKIAAVNLIAQYSLLNTANFSSGVYYVSVTDKEGRSTTRKLVISK